jgi:AraC-like DNA-binding protein
MPGEPQTEPSAVLPSLRFDTADLSAEEAFAAWSRTMVGFEVSRADDGMPFHAVADAWQFGDLVISRTRLSAVRAIRAARHIRRDRIDHYSVVTQVAGEWRAEIARREIYSASGITWVFDKSEPFTIVSRDMTDVIIMLAPRAVLDAAAGGMALHGHAVRNAAGRLLSQYLHLLVTQLPTMTEAEAPHVAQATAALLLSCVQASNSPPEARSPADVVRRAARWIDSNIQGPITPDSLQIRLNLSRSTLYRAFEPLGGVAGFIRQRRLARIHALISAGEPGSVAVFAGNFGFGSATQLTRAFSAHFGYSITDLRSRGPATEPVPTADTADHLTDWISLL